MPLNKISVSPSNHQVTVSTSYANEILINYVFMTTVFSLSLRRQLKRNYEILVLKDKSNLPVLPYAKSAQCNVYFHRNTVHHPARGGIPSKSIHTGLTKQLMCPRTTWLECCFSGHKSCLKRNCQKKRKDGAVSLILRSFPVNTSPICTSHSSIEVVWGFFPSSTLSKHSKDMQLQQ